jgi:transposase
MSTAWDRKLNDWRERRQNIYKDRMDGLSLNVIGRKYGVSAQSIARIVVRYENELEKKG